MRPSHNCGADRLHCCGLDRAARFLFNPTNCRPQPCPRPPPCPPWAPCALQMQHQQRVLQVWKKYNCNPFKSLLGIFVQVRARCVGCFWGAPCHEWHGVPPL